MGTGANATLIMTLMGYDDVAGVLLLVVWTFRCLLSDEVKCDWVCALQNDQVDGGDTHWRPVMRVCGVSDHERWQHATR